MQNNSAWMNIPKLNIIFIKFEQVCEMLVSIYISITQFVV